MPKKSIYKQKWRVVECGVTEYDCWCRMVVLPSWTKETDDMDDCVVPAGCLSKGVARYLVKLHNKVVK